MSIGEGVEGEVLFRLGAQLASPCAAMLTWASTMTGESGAMAEAKANREDVRHKRYTASSWNTEKHTKALTIYTTGRLWIHIRQSTRADAKSAAHQSSSSLPRHRAEPDPGRLPHRQSQFTPPQPDPPRLLHAIASGSHRQTPLTTLPRPRSPFRSVQPSSRPSHPFEAHHFHPTHPPHPQLHPSKLPRPHLLLIRSPHHGTYHRQPPHRHLRALGLRQVDHAQAPLRRVPLALRLQRLAHHAGTPRRRGERPRVPLRYQGRVP